MESLPDVPETAIPFLLAAQIAAALTFAPLFNTLFALGEELGWRGICYLSSCCPWDKFQPC
jgi:membrane protease YdiL (CAAX protease family)